LLVPEISRVTGVLTEGIGISWYGSSFSIGVTDDSAKSSSLKASHENCRVPFLAKAAVIFFAVKKLDMQHFLMMPGEGLISLYRDLQSSNYVVPRLIFL